MNDAINENTIQNNFWFSIYRNENFLVPIPLRNTRSNLKILVSNFIFNFIILLFYEFFSSLGGFTAIRVSVQILFDSNF